jgi:hypothetical protein
LNPKIDTTLSFDPQSIAAQASTNVQQNGSTTHETLNSGPQFNKMGLPQNSTFMLSNPFNVPSNNAQLQPNSVNPFANITALNQTSSYFNPLLNMATLRQQGEQCKFKQTISIIDHFSCWARNWPPGEQSRESKSIERFIEAVRDHNKCPVGFSANFLSAFFTSGAFPRC